MNIQGKKVVLRAVEEKDLELLHRWSNDPYTQDIMGGIHFPSSRAFHDKWFQDLQGDTLNQKWAIEAPDVGLIGLTSMMKIDWRNNHAWHGVMLGDKDIRGKGYGIDNLMTCMRYAFEEMHLERLDGSIVEYNTIAHNLYCNKLGWVEEGRRRNYYFRRGRYWDQIVVGITKQDYADLVERTKYWDE